MHQGKYNLTYHITSLTIFNNFLNLADIQIKIQIFPPKEGKENLNQR